MASKYKPRNGRPADEAQTVASPPEKVKEASQGLVPDWIQRIASIGLRVAGPMVGTAAGATLGAPAFGVGAVPGGAAGGALGAAAVEPLAQMIEPGGRTRKFNWGRGAVNTATGAIPGKFLTSIPKGAAIGYATVAGDKALAQGKSLEESLNPMEWSPAEVAMGPVFGGTFGGVLSRLGGGRQPKVNPTKTKGTVTPVGTNDAGGKVWRVKPDEKLKQPNPSTAEKFLMEEETRKAANAAAGRIATKQTATVKQSLGQAGQDVRPSTHTGLQPSKVGTVAQNLPEAEMRFSVPDPTAAQGLDTVPKGKGGLVYSASSEVPSDATQRALSRPANPRMKNQQVSRSRTQAAQAERAETAAELADVKTIVKDKKTAQVEALKAAKEKEKVLQNVFKSALARKETQAGKMERLEDQFRTADWRRNQTYADDLAESAEQAKAKDRIDSFLAEPDVQRSDEVLVDTSTVNRDGRTETIRQIARKVPPPKADPDAVPPSTPPGVDPAKPAPDPTSYSVNQIPAREELATQVIRNGKTAARLARKTKADDIVRVKGPDGKTGYRLVYKDIPFTEPTPPAPAPPTPTPAPKGPKPKPTTKLGVSESIVGQRPWHQLKEKDQLALVPLIQKAVEDGHTGDLEQLGDELAEMLGEVRTNRADVTHAGRSNSALIQTIKKLGGIGKDAEKLFKGEIDWLKQSPLKKMGIFPKDVGLSLDGILEGIRQEGKFPHINSTNDLLEELRKAGAQGIDEGDVFAEVDKMWRGAGSGRGLKAKPKVVEPEVPTQQLERAPKSYEDIAEQTGVTTGQTPFKPGATAKPEGIVLSATENQAPGKVKWDRVEFPPKGNKGATVAPVQATAAAKSKPAPKAKVPSAAPSSKSAKMAEADKSGEQLDAMLTAIHGDDWDKLKVNPEGHGTAPNDWVAEQLAEIEKLVAGKNAPKAAEAPMAVDEFAEALAKEGEKPIAEVPFSLEAPTAKPKVGKTEDLFKGQKGEIDPKLMMQLGAAGVGGLTGAALDDENRLRGAALGAGVGFAGTGGLRMIPSLMKSGETAKDLVEPLASRFPNYMRGSLLSDPRSIAINSVLGPWGSQTTGGVELLLKGLASGDERQVMGIEALKRAEPVSWIKNFFGRSKEAAEAIHNVDAQSRAGTFQDVQNPNALDRLMEKPAVSMLMGDLTSKGNLKAAGVPDELAREITITNEPRRAITKGITNIVKAKSGLDEKGQTSNVMKAMLPFTRTAANILESGTERTPILGSIINTFGDPTLKIPNRDVLVQQGLGGVAWGLGYAAGNLVDEDTARAFKIHSAVSNLGGQYSLLANAGFMTAQARKKGKTMKDAFWDSTKRAYLTEGFPLPTTQPLGEGLDLVEKLTSDPANLGVKDLPGFAVPGAVKFAHGEVTKAPGSIRELISKPPQRRSRSRYRPRKKG